MNHELVHNGSGAACSAPNQTEARTARRKLPVASPRFRSTGTPEALLLTIELPGVAPEAVSLYVEDGVLHLDAQQSLAPAGQDVLRQALEFQLADFKGRWRLPENVDPDGVTSALRHGVLSVRLPLRQPARRTIAVG